MLRYIAFGTKDFHKYPVPPCARLNWEFYAITKGKCAPSLAGCPEVPLQSNTLWLMPPQLAYGWRTSQQTGYRYCFHFPMIPKEVQECIGNQKYLSARLSPSDIRQLDSIAKETLIQFKNPHSYSHLYYEKTLLELCLLILNGNPEKKKVIPLERLAEERTVSAIAWFSSYMCRNPTVDEVASVLHMTSTHLRRMTQKARGLTPHQIFRELQIKRSLDMLSNSTNTVEEIGKECGFQSAADFARVFRQKMGVSANTWRTKRRLNKKTPSL